MLLLASQSPRRAELLNQMGLQFSVQTIDIDETPRRNERPEDYVLRLAIEKSNAGWQQSAGLYPVLGADTIVVAEQQILGKPRDEADAHAMLRMLSGATHQVYTAVCITQARRQVWATVTTEVSFTDLTEQQITDYWASGEPLGKAGSYAIQGFAGQFVTQIKGSYSTVVGLPLFETRQLLNQLGYHP